VAIQTAKARMSITYNYYNIQLSAARAKTVSEYLVSHGVSASRLSSKGYGESQPIDTNDTMEGKANNRRTEFKIIG